MNLQATKVRTITPHLDSVEAPCSYASYCGGCKTQNLSYEAQIRAKEQQVHELITHVGKFSTNDPEFLSIMKPIVPCDIQFHYRNKVSMAMNHVEIGHLINIVILSEYTYLKHALV